MRGHCAGKGRGQAGPGSAPSPLRSVFILLTLLQEVGQRASAGAVPWAWPSGACPGPVASPGTGIVLLELLKTWLQGTTGEPRNGVTTRGFCRAGGITFTGAFKSQFSLFGRVSSAAQLCCESFLRAGRSFSAGGRAGIISFPSSLPGSICERVTPRLSHANSAVVLSAVKVLMKFMEMLSKDLDYYGTLLKKLAPPLVTLLSAEPELQYVALRNINLIVQKRCVSRCPLFASVPLTAALSQPSMRGVSFSVS